MFLFYRTYKVLNLFPAQIYQKLITLNGEIAEQVRIAIKPFRSTGTELHFHQVKPPLLLITSFRYYPEKYSALLISLPPLQNILPMGQNQMVESFKGF